MRNRPYVNFKTIRTIAHIFVAFSEKLSFTPKFCQGNEWTLEECSEKGGEPYMRLNFFNFQKSWPLACRLCNFCITWIASNFRPILKLCIALDRKIKKQKIRKGTLSKFLYLLPWLCWTPRFRHSVSDIKWVLGTILAKSFGSITWRYSNSSSVYLSE